MKRLFAAHLGLLATLTWMMPAGLYAKDKKKDPDEIGNRRRTRRWKCIGGFDEALQPSSWVWQPLR